MNNCVVRTKVVKNDLNPDWGSFVINVKDCGTMDTVLDVEVWDDDGSRNDELIGSTNTTLREIIFSDSLMLPIFNPNHKPKITEKYKKYLPIKKKNCGIVKVTNVNPNYPNYPNYPNTIIQ